MSIRRVYETTTIINVIMGEQEVESIIEKITAYIKNRGGEIEEINKWGNRHLAYPIEKKHNGYYLHIVYNIQPVEVPAIERFLVLDDSILRHLTLQLSPELREFRRQKSLAEGKSGETILSSVVEVGKVITAYGDDTTYVLTGEGTAEEISPDIMPALADDIDGETN